MSEKIDRIVNRLFRICKEENVILTLEKESETILIRDAENKSIVGKFISITPEMCVWKILSNKEVSMPSDNEALARKLQEIYSHMQIYYGKSWSSWDSTPFGERSIWIDLASLLRDLLKSKV